MTASSRRASKQCDLGAANADTPNAGCRTDCRLPRCGDGIVDDLRGEQCDDGGTAPGDGCSSLCFLELPATAELIPGRGSPFTDCAIEWATDHPTHDRHGNPDVKQSCRDGDAACDGGTVAGECVFHVWLCANNHDPHLPGCTPGSAGVGIVSQVDIKKPSSHDASRRVEDAQNRSRIFPAAAAARLVGFDACGPRMDLRVPLKAPGHLGSKKLKLRGQTLGGVVDSDSLKLICLP